MTGRKDMDVSPPGGAASGGAASGEGEGPGFFDRPQVRRALWIILIALCASFGLAGFVVDVSGKFPVEDFGLFYGIFGFLVFSFIVLAGQHLRKILMRPEDYYDR